VSGFFLMLVTVISTMRVTVILAVLRVMTMTGMMIVELSRAVWPIEIVTLTRHAQNRTEHQEQGKKFHRGVF
jgi:hypothetical protein